MQQGTAPRAGEKGKGSEALAVAAYMRVSTAEQKRRYGIPAQADATRTFVEKRSALRLAGSWEDLGESGSTTSRPALNELLAEIAAGRFDVVLVSSLDRLGRTEAAIWCCLWQIEDAGAVLECCDQALGEPGLDRWLTMDRLVGARAVNPVRISWPYGVRGGPARCVAGRSPLSGFEGRDVLAPGLVP
jgi:hypothetical protein